MMVVIQTPQPNASAIVVCRRCCCRSSVLLASILPLNIHVIMKLIVGYLQSLDGSYIMKRFLINVNENIQTHITAGKEETQHKQYINVTS